MFDLVLLGPPGAGKGTQAKLISDKYKVPHISTGEILRNKIKEASPLGTKAKEYMNKGELVPDVIVLELLKERLEADDCINGFLLDGFPRNVYQAEELNNYLTSKEKTIDMVINLEVEEDVLLNRMIGRRVCKECGANYHVENLPPKQKGICDVCGGEVYQRADDKEETVKNRFNVYHKQTAPLIDYYQKAGVLIPVKGDGGPEKVFASIVSAIGV